jgi:hypothetical protein
VWQGRSTGRCNNTVECQFRENLELRVLETSVFDLGPALADNGKTSLLEVQMDWSCFAEELYVGDWRVEGRDHENEGQVYIAIFSGPKARERAQEYADWKISKEEPRPRLHKVG